MNKVVLFNIIHYIILRYNFDNYVPIQFCYKQSKVKKATIHIIYVNTYANERKNNKGNLEQKAKIDHCQILD